MSSNLVMTTGAQPVELTVSFTVPANSPAGSIVQGNISAFGPLVAASNTIVIPITEVWHIIDMYVIGAPAAVDATIIPLINGYVQNVNPKLSSVNLNLLTRFRLPMSLPLSPSSTIAVSISTLALSGGATATQILTVKVTRAPYTG